jgi:antitoxin component YwqK of YwqJK toxin-antitoxin module
MQHQGGKPHGLYQRWWADGSKRLEAGHVEGRLDGEFKNWLEDGTVYEVAVYRRGNKVESSRR